MSSNKPRNTDRIILFQQPGVEPTFHQLILDKDRDVAEQLVRYGYASATAEAGGNVKLERPGHWLRFKGDFPARRLETVLRSHDLAHIKSLEPTSSWTREDGPIRIEWPFGFRVYEDGLPKEVEGEERSFGWQEIQRPLQDFTHEEMLELPLPLYEIWDRQKAFLQAGREYRGRSVVQWPDGAWSFLPVEALLESSERRDAVGSLAYREYSFAREELVRNWNAALEESRISKGLAA